VLADYCNDRGGYSEKVAATAGSCDEAAANADARLRAKLDAAQASCELEGGNFSMDGDVHPVGNETDGPVSLQSSCTSLSDGTTAVVLRQCVRCGL
jgi:uncharacterized protein with LGFP repeats